MNDLPPPPLSPPQLVTGPLLIQGVWGCLGEAEAAHSVWAFFEPDWAGVIEVVDVEESQACPASAQAQKFASFAWKKTEGLGLYRLHRGA